MAEFTHVDGQGRVKMVEVTEKAVTVREAVARGTVRMHPSTLERIRSGTVAKGEVLAVARTAGIMAAKETARLIPLCHPLMLTGVTVDFRYGVGEGILEIQARVKTAGQTGVEMEALTAVSVAALTIYDMCKAVDKEMVIGDIRLVEKSGGRSGRFSREGETEWQDVF
ncbi:MAG: cyclic pyranopterin monophosphate synthase MoaC [Clostridia bacterium]|nr:cyclic pyranopterin monophosphate synthase MoaC [Clostridia bacterium]